jgi:branched-chain amino acid transport system permease protein
VTLAANFLGLHLSSTLWGVLLLNSLFAYSAYPVIALGRMNLAFMAFAGIGGYTAAILKTKHGVDPALGIFAGMAMSALLALPVGAVLGRVRGIYVAIASVNLVAAFQITASGVPSLTGGALGIENLPLVATNGVLVGAVAGVVVLFWLFARSRSGLAVRLQRSDQLLALACGVDT